MSRPYFAILLCPLLLTACVAPSGTSTLPTAATTPATTTPTAPVMQAGLLQSLLDNECRAQLNKRQEWQAVAIAMGKPTQQRWEQKVCGCVSDEAARNLSSGEMLAAINPSTRSQVLSKLAAQSVGACLQKILAE